MRKLSQLVMMFALFACGDGAAAVVECNPGGRCEAELDAGLQGAANALGLADLRTIAPPSDSSREVRFWSVDYHLRSGTLHRFREDSSGAVLLSRSQWWLAADSAVREMERRIAQGMCPSIAAQGDFEVCEYSPIGMPYAFNRLHELEAFGALSLKGSTAKPDTTEPCFHLCTAPARLVMELRVGRKYRTYGYAIFLSAPDSAWRVFNALRQ